MIVAGVDTVLLGNAATTLGGGASRGYGAWRRYDPPPMMACAIACQAAVSPTGIRSTCSTTRSRPPQMYAAMHGAPRRHVIQNRREQKHVGGGQIVPVRGPQELERQPRDRGVEDANRGEQHQPFVCLRIAAKLIAAATNAANATIEKSGVVRNAARRKAQHRTWPRIDHNPCRRANDDHHRRECRVAQPSRRCRSVRRAATNDVCAMKSAIHVVNRKP